MRSIKKGQDKYDLALTYSELIILLERNKRPNVEQELLQIREPLAGRSFYIYDLENNVCERAVTMPYGWPKLTSISQTTKNGQIEVAASLPKANSDWDDFQTSTAFYQMTRTKLLVIRDVNFILKELTAFMLQRKKEAKDEENCKEEALAIAGAIK